MNSTTAGAGRVTERGVQTEGEQPSPAPPVFDSILEAIGATPVVHLRRLSPEGGAAIYAKLEQLNPTGSLKDRIALSMIEAAERDGLLKPGGTVIEPTSGNTGIGLALVCAVKGYRLILTMPESMSLERRALLEAYGVEVVLTPEEQAMDGAVQRAEQLARETGAFMPQQFSNPANPEAHRQLTAAEIEAWIAAEGAPLDAFVAGVGTGGTITGVGEALKARHPGLQFIAVEPDGSAVLSGEPAGPTKIQGLGAGFVPEVLDRGSYTAIERVTDRDAWAMKQRIAAEEGILAGISSGANLEAAVRVARALGPGKRVLTLIADTGERYFSLGEFFE